MKAKFKKGDIVRYAEGCSALCCLQAPHAGGWHAAHALGGIIFVFDIQHASAEEQKQYHEYRREYCE